MNEPTTTKDDTLARLANRIREYRAKSPNVKVRMKGQTAHLDIGNPDDYGDRLRLMAGIGTLDSLFFGPLLSQIGNAVSPARVISEESLQFAVSVIKSIGPKNELEAMLAAQMAAVHVCAMDSSRRFLSITANRIPCSTASQRV